MEETRRIEPVGEPTVVVGPGTATQGPSVTVECIPGKPRAYAGGASTAHVLVLIRAASSASGRRPLNLALAIDRSGSMEGDPIAYVKQACSHVVDLLTPSDVLSVVTFEDQVDVVMPARRVVNRELIKQHIARITTGRTTNLFDGLLTACNQVASVPDGQHLKRVLLLTDGEPTAGIRDFASIVGLAADQKAKGIVISALGFGPEYNEELLAGIARRSGGNYYYISRPDLIPEVFRRELSLLLSVAALNMRLTLHVPRWARVRKVYSTQAAISGRTAQIELVDLEAGATLAVLVQLEFEPRPAGPYRVLKADLAYTDA
ncbi:MAG: vWA domain-containing protein, partial [Armatimonadota bacterium]